MANYFRPGVYINEVSALPPSVLPVETAIPAFIGYTGSPLAPNIAVDTFKLVPKKIYSLQEYEQYFGLPQAETDSISVVVIKDKDGNVIPEEVMATVNESKRSKHIMYYSLQAYFLNGGGPCWIVSVDAYAKVPGAIEVGDATKGLLAGLDKVELIDEVTILVFPEGSRLSDKDRKTLYDTALQQCEKKKNRFLITDVMPAAPGTQTVETIAKAYRDSSIGFNNLKYGAAYMPDLVTTLDFNVDDANVKVTITSSAPPETKKLKDLKNDQLALYNLIVAKINDIPLTLPPSPIMAGIYVQVDQKSGVYKAPANVSLNGVVAPSMRISDAEHDKLNLHSSGKSINAIRGFAGRGVLVFGARTLAGNDNEWRYISVRRFFNFAEVSIRNTILQFLFEPNDRNTWERVKAMIANFLTNQWQEGALLGDNADQAFFVRVGLGSTMTAVDILEGRLIVEVGMAVVRPAEFIILKFSHLMQVS